MNKATLSFSTVSYIQGHLVSCPHESILSRFPSPTVFSVLGTVALIRHRRTDVASRLVIVASIGTVAPMHRRTVARRCLPISHRCLHRHRRTDEPSLPPSLRKSQHIYIYIYIYKTRHDINEQTKQHIEFYNISDFQTIPVIIQACI